MNDDDSRMNVRDVRAHLAEVLTRAQNGSPTVIMRNGDPVAAVVPIEDFNVLEDAIDRYFSREADRDLAENPDAPTYSMSEVVAAIFEEEHRPGRRVKYAFRWRERAVRQLRAVPQPTALTILRALTPLGDDPRRPDADIKKLAGYADRYRLRVGDYRVIYEITDSQLIILIVGVGHRREAYRALS